VGHVFDNSWSDVIVFRLPPFIRAFIARCASGDLLSSFDTGVGNQSSDDEDSLSPVRRANVVSPHHERPDGVSARFQVFDDPVSSESAEARHVLSDQPSGSHFAHQPEELRPEPAFVGVALPASGDADGLAGESSDQSVSCREVTHGHS
jgi:hypothetical protein